MKKGLYKAQNCMVTHLFPNDAVSSVNTIATTDYSSLTEQSICQNATISKSSAMKFDDHLNFRSKSQNLILYLFSFIPVTTCIHLICLP